MFEEMKITCKTCLYHRQYKNECVHSSAVSGELSERCLKKIPFHERNTTKHHLYSYIEKLYDCHEYYFWKPKEEYEVTIIGSFLDKEDFEI